MGDTSSRNGDRRPLAAPPSSRKGDRPPSARGGARQDP